MKKSHIFKKVCKKKRNLYLNFLLSSYIEKKLCQDFDATLMQGFSTSAPKFNYDTLLAVIKLKVTVKL